MWNYRIIKGTDNSYGLYETMYNDKKEIIAHDESPIIIGDSVQDLKDTVALMLSDINKCQENILEVDKITFAPMYDDEEEFEQMDLDDFIATINKND